MYQRILVPLDGSRLAEQVIPYVEVLAKRLNSQVMFITVCPPGNSAGQSLTEYVETKAEEIQSRGVKVKAVYLEGEPAATIIDFAADNDISLITILTHGRTGISHWSLGSIASKVVQRSHIPVLLIRSSQQEVTSADAEMRKILVTLDGSQFAEAVIPYIESLARAMESRVTLLRVAEPLNLPQLAAYRERENYERQFIIKLEREAQRYIARKKNTLRTRGIKVDSVLLRGKPVEVIIRYAEDESINLIAMTTHGFSGITKWAYGSVAAKVIEVASKPMLLVRPPLPGTSA